MGRVRTSIAKPSRNVPSTTYVTKIITNTPRSPTFILVRNETRSEGISESAMKGINTWAPIKIMKTVAVVLSVWNTTNFVFFQLRFFLNNATVNVRNAPRGGSGMSLPISIIRSIAATRAGRDAAVYWIALVLVIVLIGGIYLLLRSRYGLALTSIRDSEEASSSLGVDNFRTKLLVYVIAAFGTSAIGALIYLTKLRITPSAAFDINWTTTVIFIVVIGGIGTIEGPIIGTIVFFLLREPLAEFGSWYLMLLGATAVVIMLKAPEGLWGIIARRYGLHFFPVQRQLRWTVKDD